MTFTGNASDELGGSIFLDQGTATLDVTVSASTAEWRGGGLVTVGTTLTIEDSDFSQNSAVGSNADPNGNFTGSGGAVWIEGGSYTISSSVFSENSGTGTGGALYTDIKGTINTSTFDDNEANFGGALYLYETGINLDNSSFTGNEATSTGGAIRAFQSTSSAIANTTFDENIATQNGGIFAGVDGDTTFTNITANNNSTDSGGADGGGIYCDDGTVTIEDSALNNNNANDDGGAVAVFDCDLTIDSSSFESNTADSTGAAVYASSASLTVTNSSFDDNSADGSGGAIRFVDGSYQESLDVRDSVFNRNISGNYGGGIGVFEGDQVTIEDCEFTSNEGVFGGGLSVTQVAETRMQRNWLCQNNAVTAGGGLRLSSFWNSSSSFNNNLFVENASAQGGGIYVTDSAGSTFTNNTLVGNAATDGGAAYVDDSTVTSNNNLVAYTDSGYGIDGLNSALTISYNLGYENVPGDLNSTTPWTSLLGSVSGDPLLSDYTQDGDCTNDQLWLLADPQPLTLVTPVSRIPMAQHRISALLEDPV